jgi:hypothetical protein
VKITVSRNALAFSSSLKRASKRLYPEIRNARDQAGRYLEQAVRNTLEAQEFTPISEAWLEWKMEHGFDTRILFMTHIMYHMIRAKKYATSRSVMSGGVTVIDRQYPKLETLLSRAPENRIMASRAEATKSSRSILKKSSGRRRRGSSPSTTLTVAKEHEGDERKRRAFFKPTFTRELPKVLGFFREALSRVVKGIR